MNRLIPAAVLSSMLLGSAAFAQSFEPPSLPGLSDFSDVGVQQIDPPSLQIDTGPSDTNGDGDSDADFISDFAEIGEAIGEAVNGAWEGQPGAGGGEAFNPDFFNPDFFNETDPGVALLELLSAVEEEVLSSVANIALLLGLLGAVEEEVRSGLQQGRVILDSDFGPSRGEPIEDIEK